MRISSSGRVRAAVVALVTLATVAVSGGVAEAATCQPPDGITTRLYVANQVSVYTPTNLASQWTVFPKGGTIGYSEQATAAVSAAVSASVSAEAGVIFAKASTTIGTTVGKTWSRASTWTYTANVPADTRHKYRLHLYHLSYNFTVYKQYFASCAWRNYAGFPSAVGHAPAASASASVWRLDSAAA